MDSKESEGVNLENKLREILHGNKVAIIGVGNPLRGDDAAGPYVASLIEQYAKGSVRDNFLVVNAESAPENFLGTIVNFNPDVIIFIDAVETGLKPGSVIISSIDSLEDTVTISTHKVSLKAIGEYLAASTKVKGIYMIGIQVKNVGMGAPISSPVKKSCEKLSATLAKLLKEFC